MLAASEDGQEISITSTMAAIIKALCVTLNAACIGRVCFWDLVEEGLVQSLQAHKHVVTAMALHPAATCLATASTDGLIQIWS